jgi:hypothetical protein
MYKTRTLNISVYDVHLKARVACSYDFARQEGARGSFRTVWKIEFLDLQEIQARFLPSSTPQPNHKAHYAMTTPPLTTQQYLLLCAVPYLADCTKHDL